jgi:hypothetical protein
MMRTGERDRAIIRDRLMSRYRVSRSLAYEYLDIAVDEFAKLSRFPAHSWTQRPEDSGVQTAGANDE